MSQNYMIDYNAELEKHSQWIKHYRNHHEYETLDDIINTAKCILIHNSFPDTIETERIKAEAKKNNIPLVVFSNSFTGTVFENDSKTAIKEIKKDRMYFHLLYFLNEYKNNGIIRLELLVTGKNYEIEKTKIIIDRLTKYLFDKKDSFYYNRAFDLESNERKDLKEIFHFIQPECDFDEIDTELESYDVMQLKEKINRLKIQIINKYER